MFYQLTIFCNHHLRGTSSVVTGPAPSLVLALTFTEYGSSGFNPPMTANVELPGASIIITCLFLRLESGKLGVNVIVIEAMKPLASTSDGSSQETFMWVPFKRVV